MCLLKLVPICAVLFSFVPWDGWVAPQPSREILRLRIVNDAEGEIAVSKDAGATWSAVGRVVQYTAKVNRKGYTASKWVPPGRVAATAVNAVHISAGYNVEDDRGVVFSLLPKEFLTPPKDYASFLSPDSSIYTDMPAGTGIFGGGAAPFVGNEVLLETCHGLTPMPEEYVPARGDVLVIVIVRPLPYPSDAIFDNWEGGRVTLGFPDGSRMQVGSVIRPVRGVGRFLGAVHAGIGRIRANHAGVVDVATSPIGKLGAFQIIPLAHAYSPEMQSAWSQTQWMIVAPLGEGPGQWSGITPLFYGHLRPDYLPDDLRAQDWERRLLARFLVDVDTGAGWRPMPALVLDADPTVPLPDWAGEALSEVQRIRILFPLADR